MFVVLSHSACGGVLQRTISDAWDEGGGQVEEEAERGRKKEERA